MRQYTRDDLTFDVIDRGPSDGEPIVLLHGWPATASSWDAVATILVDEGSRILAPDQRGYSARARPHGRRAYVMAELVADVMALIDAADLDRVHLVGHDWGGAVAWALAGEHPERLSTMTVLSTPHPRAMQRAMVSSTQLLHSMYAVFFQVPVLPEMLLLARDGGVGRAVLGRSGLSTHRASEYMARQMQPGMMTATLAWYRALPLRSGIRSDAEVSTPTLYVWSTGDAALGRRAAELTGDCVVGPYRFEILEGVSHWIPEEVPDKVAHLILDHIAAHRP